MPFKYSSPQERIIANSVIDESGYYNGSFCWRWLGHYKSTRTSMRYPALGIRVRGKNRKVTVHRFIITKIHGRRLSKRQVGMHLCNNEWCCNFDHVAGGTQKKNIQHQVASGRHNWWAGVNARREQREKQAA